MQWHMIILYKDNENSCMSITKMRKELSAMYRESNLPDDYKVFAKEVSASERHYFFSPTVSSIAKDILATHNAFSIEAPTPEEINGLRLIKLCHDYQPHFVGR